MITYLIKSSLCLVCFLVFYRFALENENMHCFKRFYLLGSIIVAFSLPLLTFSYYSDALPQETNLAAAQFYEIENVPLQEKEKDVNPIEKYTPMLLWGLYAIGVFLFGLRFLRNLLEMHKKISKNRKIRFKNHVKVLLEQKTAPHSFLHYIFMNKKAFQNQDIAPEILLHEETHVKQRHSLDILLVELLQVVFWFNPLFLILKKHIRINHEFLADENVIRKNVAPIHYTNLLFNYSAGINHSTLSSPFNHLLIKKRIVMISKPFSKQRLLSRVGMFVPVLAGCIFFFNNEINAKPLPIASEEVQRLQQDSRISISVQQDEVFLNGKKVSLSKFANELDKITKGKTDADLREMNFNFVSSNPRKDLMSALNEEYKKTRFASIKGNDLLPPAAPKAPKASSVPPAAPPVPPTPAEHEQNIKEELQKADSLKLHYEERFKKAEEGRAEMLQRIEERKKEMDARILEMEKKREEHGQERQQLLEMRRAKREEQMQQLEERRNEVEEKPFDYEAFLKTLDVLISVEQEKIFLNGRKVALSKFAQELDNITKGKTDLEIQKMSYTTEATRPNKDLLNKLNKEFKKTRFSSVREITEIFNDFDIVDF